MGKRDDIVDAAVAIVRERGINRLTLDEAAKVAGVSKGGVLYHFKTKDDLVAAMVARLMDQCELLRSRHYDALPEGPYRWAKANILTAFESHGPAADPVGGALLAAAVENSDLVRPIETRHKQWLERLMSDAPEPQLALLAGLAMDGLWLHDLVGLSQLGEAERARLRDFALRLLDGTENKQ